MVWRLPDEISVVPQRNEIRLPGRQNIITFANHKQSITCTRKSTSTITSTLMMTEKLKTKPKLQSGWKEG